jgi:hypothetical protein
MWRGGFPNPRACGGEEQKLQSSGLSTLVLAFAKPPSMSRGTTPDMKEKEGKAKDIADDCFN